MTGTDLLDRVRIRLLLGVTVSAAFVYLLVDDLDWEVLRHSLGALEVAPLLAGLLFLVADYFVRLVRWHWMLRALQAPVTLAQCARPFLVGFALNNVLPLRAGDLARAVGFRRTLAVPASRVLGTLLLERLLDLLVLLGILGVGLALVGEGGPLSPDLRRIGLTAVLSGALLLGVVIGLAVAARRVPGIRPVPVATGRRRDRVRGWFMQLGDVVALLAGVRHAVPLLVLSVTAWLLEAGVFAAAAWALGMDTDGVLLAMGTGTLGTLLPGAPGHLGTFDYFTMVGLVAAGAERDPATAFAVLVHVLLWLPLTLTGLALLAIKPTVSGPAERIVETDEIR